MTPRRATWQDLRRVARECGEGDEGVDHIERLDAPDSVAPRGPILLLGTPDSGLSLVLQQAGGEVAREIASVPGRPYAVTPRSREHRLLSDMFGSEAGIVLAAREPFTAAKVSSLASDGPFALSVVVTRLSQPLPELERRIIRSVSRAVAGFIIVVAAVPGERPTDEELDQVQSFLLSRLTNEVGEGRVLRLLWCDVAIENAPLRVWDVRSGTQSLAKAIEAIPEADLLRARDAACRAELRRFLSACRARSQNLPTRPRPPLTEADQRKVLADGEAYFNMTWNELERKAHDGLLASTARAREVAVTMWRSWTQPRDPGGIWLAYLDRLRPGTLASFENEIEQWASSIDATPITTNRRAATNPSAMLGIRVLMSVGFAVAAYVAAESLLADALPLRGMWVSFCFALGALLAWMGTSLWKTVPASRDIIDAEPSRVALQGGELLLTRFRAWLEPILRDQPLDLQGECDRLAAAFGITRADPAGGAANA